MVSGRSSWAAGLLCLLMILSLVLGSCGDSKGQASQGGATSEGRSGGTLRWASQFEPQTLNAAFRNPAAYPSAMSHLVFDGLTRLDPEKGFTPVPGLATSWEGSPDGTVYTFTLRDGVRWHDGQPFSADDVKFTMDAIRDPKNRATTYTDFALVDSVEVVDPRTVRIRLKQPYAPLLTNLAVSIIPKHLLEGKDLTTAEFNQRPVGTGPFRFVEWRKGESITLEAFPDSWRGRPKLDRIVITFVPDESARLVQLKTGEVHGARLEAKQVGEFKSSDSVVLLRSPTATARAFAVNLRDPRFADPRVRVALNYAVDKEAIVKTAGGTGMAARGPLQNTPYDKADGPTFAYDPSKVEQLMAAAGWQKNASGVFQKDGKTFSFTLIAPVFLDEATVMATSLRAAGFDVKVEQKDYTYVYSNTDQFEAVMYSFGSPVDPDAIYFLFHSSGHIDKAGFNFFYTNAKVDALLDQARTTTDPVKRKALYADVQVEVAADPPYIWAWYPDSLVAVRKDLTGPSAKALACESADTCVFWNAETWSLE
jgi:peptide/nickel transport system substrate-binding protein